MQKIGIFFLVFVLEKFFKDLGFNDTSLRVFHLPESRFQIDLTEIIAQQKRAETVNGSDLRVVKQDFLPLEMGVSGVIPKPCGESFSYTLPHLRGGRLCECDDQKPVYIRGILPFRDQPDDPLDKDCGLTAARRCRDKDIVISGVKHFLLVLCKLNCHICIHPILFSYPGMRGSNPQESR